jgi:hypothetical protein
MSKLVEFTSEKQHLLELKNSYFFVLKRRKTCQKIKTLVWTCKYAQDGYNDFQKAIDIIKKKGGGVGTCCIQHEILAPHMSGPKPQQAAQQMLVVVVSAESVVAVLDQQQQQSRRSWKIS